MGNTTDKPRRGLMKRFLGGFTLTKINILLWGAIAIIAIIAGWQLFRSVSETKIEINTDNRIDVTPTIVTAMKEIGEWQFLSISDEELVDTSKSSFLREDKLVRIYYGTLSLGIDMHNVEPQWISQSGDTVTVILPEIQLLDNDFIDEARTKAFIETGTWSNSDREALYKKAYARMKKRCLTEENFAAARKNATEQVGKMLHSMGINNCIITFGKRK